MVRNKWLAEWRGGAFEVAPKNTAARGCVCVLSEQCDVGKSATVRGDTQVKIFSEFTVRLIRAGEKGHIGCHSFGPPCSRGVLKVWNYFGRNGDDSAAIFLWMPIDSSRGP
jgi:hypothetical protein